MSEPRVVREKMGLLSNIAPQSRSERRFGHDLFGNKAGIKFMLLCFWLEVTLALDGMAGTLGCMQLRWAKSEGT